VRRLLFLNGIKAFEAAARTGSFAAAGASSTYRRRGQPDGALLEEGWGGAVRAQGQPPRHHGGGPRYQSGLTRSSTRWRA